MRRHSGNDSSGGSRGQGGIDAAAEAEAQAQGPRPETICSMTNRNTRNGGTTTTTSTRTPPPPTTAAASAAAASASAPSIVEMNPASVEEMVTQEMGKLSFQDRNAIYEEIHGVVCLAPHETTDFVATALVDIAHELERLQYKYTAYTKATTTPTIIPTQGGGGNGTADKGGGGSSSSHYNNPYVHGVELRLRFLRTELFDSTKAAVRMLKYLDLTYELFGSCALYRPIQLQDLTKQDLEMLRVGDAQPVPFRDRSGRRVVVACNHFGMQYPLEVRIRVCTYIYWAISEDEESQRKGTIGLICWPSAAEALAPDKFAVVYSPKDVPRHIHLSARMFESLPVRLVGVHICFPDKSIYHLMRAAIILSFGETKNRIRFHSGDSVESQYHLHGYGIPIDQIPITASGHVKTKNQHQWIRVRKYLESSRMNNTPTSNIMNPATTTAVTTGTGISSTHNNSITQYQCGYSDDSEASGSEDMSTKIDCPNMNDVVFRTKHAYLCHPGNAMFRGLVEKHYHQHSTAITTDEKVAITWSIVNEVDQRQGRFLVWDPNGYWKQLRDRTLIRTKVAGALKDHKRRVKAKANHQVNHSSTSVFQQQGCHNNIHKKRKVTLNRFNHDRTHTTAITNNNIVQEQQMLIQSSDIDDILGMGIDNNDTALAATTAAAATATRYTCFGW